MSIGSIVVGVIWLLGATMYLTLPDPVCMRDVGMAIVCVATAIAEGTGWINLGPKINLWGRQIGRAHV